jgi:streptomycin 6-kinase
VAAVLILDTAARERLIDRFGPDVIAWCDELPTVVARLTRRWGLRVEGAVPGNTGRTLRCRTAHDELVVLKLTPHRDIAQTEATALRAWQGCPRAVDLLDTDLDAGAILLAGIEPGTPLTERGWAPREIEELLVELHGVAVPAGLPSLTERVHAMFDLAQRRAGNLIAPRLMAASRAASRELAADGPRRLVHGDLHPANVLAGAQGVVAIDPRPCVGDPAFDAVDWVLREDRDLDESIAALPSVDPERLRRWCAALSVLVAMAPLRREGPSPYTEYLLGLAAAL